MKFCHFGPKNHGEKWYRINIFEIATCQNPFLDPFIYFIKRMIFFQNEKFSNKNDLVFRMKEIKKKTCLLHFAAFFRVASLFSMGVDNEKALELDNRIFFHISA